MKIIYPPLVEESIHSPLSEQKQELVDKAEMYRTMVEKGIISENGEPTAFALEQGFVKEFTEEAALTLEQFLEIYPVFEHYDVKMLKKIDGFWEIPICLKETMLLDMEANKFSYDECVQIEEYLADR